MATIGSVESRWYANPHAFRTVPPRASILDGVSNDTDRKCKNDEKQQHDTGGRLKDRQELTFFNLSPGTSMIP
jgi:hypothetical protein